MNFNEIYNETHPKIARFVARKIACKEDAEEIASEVFVRVHANLSNFDGNLASMNTWIFTIAGNLLIDYFRKQKEIVLQSLEGTTDEDGNEFIQIEDESNPQREIESRELGVQIMEAMTTLPATVSDVAEKYFIDEMTYKEIAKDLSVPMGTVKAHINRARQYLRNRLIAFR